jgi:hypothetical protein
LIVSREVTVDKDRSSKQTDADILRCRADILRARDVVPPHDEKDRESTDLQYTDEDTNRSAAIADPPKVCEDAAPIPIEAAEYKAAEPPKVTTVNHKQPVTNQHAKHEIPKFDLAEEIMAEQRRITAIRRKAPGQKTEAQRSEPQAQPVGYATEQPLSEQDKIIAEIVARDIEKLCRGNIRDVHRQAPRP